MRNSARRLVGVLVPAVIALGAAACPRPAPREPVAKAAAPVHFDAAAIEAWVGAELAARGAVGAALAVIRDGELAIARGYGVRRIGGTAVVDADTPFAIGSVSKQLTCAAVHLLAAEGKLALTDPVSAYYPQLTSAAAITLDDLGAHLAGYRDYYPLDYVDQRMTSPIAPDALIARYAGMPLDFPPRTRWSYSNTGYVILARIVERVAEVPYARFVEERLLRRAGLTRATLARPADAATGHEAFLLGPPEPALVEADGWLFGAGDVWASARELAQWSVSLGADVAVPAQAREAMSRPRTLADGRVSAYGCGLIPRQIAGETVLGHSGWVGGFVAYQAFVPRTRTAVVLLVNDQHVDVGDLHERVLRLALDDPRAIPSLPVPAAQAARDLLLQLQQGRLDRGTLGDDARAYFDDRRVATAAAQLRGLPAPRVSLVARAERGGLEVARLAIQLGDRVVSGVMFRSPDGKIRQLLLQP